MYSFKNALVLRVLATVVIGFGLVANNRIVAQEFAFFEVENEPADATFGWDVFTGFYSQPHTSSIGEASGVINVAPSGGFVSSTANLYAFSTLPEYTITISQLDDDQPYLNVAMQFATSDPAVNFSQIDPMPNEYIELGERASIGDGFPIYYYWVEWNGLDASTEFSAVYSGLFMHVSFAGARISYYNASQPTDITFGKQDILLGDVNCDGSINLLDIAPFVEVVSGGQFNEKADMNEDGSVNLLDVGLFVDAISNG